MVYPSKDEESFFLRDPFLSVPYVGRRLGFRNRAMTRESRKNTLKNKSLSHAIGIPEPLYFCFDNDSILCNE